MEKIAFFSHSALRKCDGELLFCPPNGLLHGVRLHVEHPGDFFGGVALPEVEHQVQEGLLHGVLSVGKILQYLHSDVAHEMPVFDIELFSLQFLFV